MASFIVHKYVSCTVFKRSVAILLYIRKEFWQTPEQGVCWKISLQLAETSDSAAHHARHPITALGAELLLNLPRL